MNPAQRITFKCIEVTQPIGSFYIGAIESRDLVKIAHSDIRRIEKREVEEYIGIERPLSAGRVAELRQFVNTVDASFPTSVILAVKSEKAQYDSDDGLMNIADEEDVAKIIDGQHRIAGLEAFSGASFQMIATIFVDMDMEDQAMVFATINLKQTKVNKSLAYDLYEYAAARSPQKTCHNIAKLLNNTESSPFANKIKILGVATGEPSETLTQATFVDRLVRYISRDPMKDRDELKRGRKLRSTDGADKARLIFRDLFVAERDAQIAKVIWNYFDAVRTRWPRAWDTVERGNVLNRTTGFGALMRLLRPAYLSLAASGPIPKSEAFLSLFANVKLDDGSFTPARFVPGSSGEADLYHLLCEATGLGE
ncbi:MAG: DGQHR domain-containing protein [Candidatus Acidiferrales bacterium]